jgi:lysozyme family protein
LGSNTTGIFYVQTPNGVDSWQTCNISDDWVEKVRKIALTIK